MTWMNVPLPECLAFGTTSQTNWRTLVDENRGGYEDRTQEWTRVKMTFDLTWAVKDENDFRELRDHHTMARGRLNSFAVTDFADWEVLAAESYVGYVSPGAFQFGKKYGTGAFVYNRKLTRFKAGTVVPKRNGSDMTPGGGAGQYAFDADTGRLTVQPDQTRGINTHVVGTTHRFNLASDFSPNVSPSDIIYASGISGTAASLLNGVPLTVAAVGTGYVTVSVNTTGLTATGGTAARRAMASELTYSAEFYVPVRYNSDSLAGVGIDRSGDSLLIRTNGIGLVEDFE